MWDLASEKIGCILLVGDEQGLSLTGNWLYDKDKKNVSFLWTGNSGLSTTSRHIYYVNKERTNSLH